MKKKLVVCGCSWMTPDNLGTPEYRDNHHSELFAKKYNYELITFAECGWSNGGIGVQIEEAIRVKPDLIFFGQTVADRIELNIPNDYNYQDASFNLDDDDDEVRLNELVGKHGGNMHILSDNLHSLLPNAGSKDPNWNHNPKHMMHDHIVRKYKIKVTEEEVDNILDAVKSYFMYMHNLKMKKQTDMWLLYAVQHKLYESKIPAIKVIDLLYYDTPWFPCITKGYGPKEYTAPYFQGSYHTSVQTQHDILKDIELALDQIGYKYSNEI
tara:strand:+ start:2183 stop:2986 length:804 start_codon:yes stop_codon:yes gene_type:complete